MGARCLLLCPLAALVLSGCRTPAPVYVVREEPELICVDEPPPEPRLEVPPAPPDESYVWQPGYWQWDEGSYDWVDGRWVEPYEGYAYVEPYYGFVDGRWHYRPPYWAPSRRHRHRRPGHGPGVVAEGPRENRPTAPVEPRVHRAPPVETRVHRAPPTEETEPHRAPPAPELLDPDRPAAGEAPIDAAHASGDLDMMREPIPPRRPRVIRIIPEPVVASYDAVRDDVVEVDLRPDVTRRPEYRGMRDGRPVFGDDPDARRPRYQGPRTIVVGDGEPSHGRGGRIIVSQPAAVDAAPPEVVRRERPFLEPDPPIRRAPPRLAPTGWRGPPPEGRPMRRAYRVAISNPPPRMAGPVHHVAPRPAPMRVAAPVSHAVQRSAPVRVSAPRVSAPSRGPAVSRRGR